MKDGSRELPERLPKEPLSASVARGLREAIMEGEFEPDDRIKQEEVARMYGVSRSPVREAFLELSSEGFVELERDVGARVTSFDVNEVTQLYLAREAIEPMMIAETCRKITDEQIAEVMALNARSEEFAADGDVAGYLRVDTEMHGLLLKASGLNLLNDMAAGLWRRTHRYRFEYNRSEEKAISRIETSVLEHRLILGAVADRASEDAADLYRIHTRRTRIKLAQEIAPDGTEQAEGESSPNPKGGLPVNDN